MNPKNITDSLCTRITILAVLLIITPSAHGQDLVVAAGTTTINALSHYTFSIFTLSVNVDQGSTIAITFPQEYSPTSLKNNAPYSGYNASLGDGCWPFGTCSVSISFRGNTFFLDGAFPQAYTGAGFFFQFSIFNIQNPDSLSVGQFPMTIFKGTTIFFPTSLGSTSFPPSFSPSTIAYSTSITINSVWTTSPLTLTLTPDTLLDQININFPNIWTN